ncbi:MAG TPA: prolipoprotein diacylglyceryl transferase [Saccharofermentans sp.]|jgi:phosphatidylglycerol:prolipoprotein diacylglycerol transferase|nr:prolipoprotein diacylglyceryl transferase [Saccharofermentans sp.]HUM23212.1 prolipoprotein diacylglyceryl transferase [Saccharofermentans sp.]
MNYTEVSFPGLGITVNIDQVAFSIFGIEVYWYGLLISLGMVLCVVLGMLHSKKNKFSSDLVFDVILVSLPCAIVGARLYYVLSEWEMYSGDLIKIFDTRSGGLAVYGGILGAFIGTLIMCKIRKIPFSAVVDFCVVYIPLGQAIGRWGNFFNQECFGTTTTLPWGMKSSEVESYLRLYFPDLDSTMAVHPTFFYEFLATITIFFILLYVRKYSKHAFESMAVYMILYGVARFFIEGLRTDSLYIGDTGIRTSQLFSAVLVVSGVIYLVVAYKKNIKRVYISEELMNKTFLDSNKKVEKVEKAVREETNQEVSVSSTTDVSSETDDNANSEDGN